MGPPDNPAFQKKVLLALMAMFEAPNGPLLEDFPEEEPESNSEIFVLACPVDFGQYTEDTGETDKLYSAFLNEISAMRTWYDMAVTKRNRTAVGISGIDLDVLGDFIYAFVKGEEPENPREDVPLAYTLKFAAEDLHSYYVEGITAQPGQGSVSSDALTDWFWYKTIAGKVLLALRKSCQASKDDIMRQMGDHFLVPPEVTLRMGDAIVDPFEN